MRIAVSGTHCSGKSTLIEEFLQAHPDFVFEPEPYTVMVEDFGEEFSSEPCADDFYRQLKFNIARLNSHAAGARVIYERCPLDFVAYLLALKDLQLDDLGSAFDTARSEALSAIENLDLIVFLPLNSADGIETPESENPRLRRSVNARLVAIYGDDEFGLISGSNVPVVEVSGSREQRLRRLEAAVESHTALKID